MKIDDSGLKATDKEKNIFLQNIDTRLEEFKKAVSRYSSDSNIFNYLCDWCNELQKEIKEVFCQWYENNIKGIKIPKNVIIPKPKQDKIYNKYTDYFLNKSCEVCGDTRVLNIAHIIPRAADGKDEEWNLMRLCANHHYLFDQGKLTEEEWNKIDWNKRPSVVQEYVLRIRKQAHEYFEKYGNTVSVLFPDGTSKFMDKYEARKMRRSERLKWLKKGIKQE